MASGMDIPVEVKNFYKKFETLSRKYYEPQILEDFLTLFMANFSMDPVIQGDWNQAKTRYTPEEIKVFGELVVIYITDLNKIFQESDLQWFDFFGTLYEFISSQSKRAGLGQFFTPATIVNFMVISKGDMEPGTTVNDPSCGSGRFLIAAHATHPHIRVFGEDLDLLCCKMSVVNCLMSGCDAEIVWRDSLDPNSYNRGWKIHFPEIKGLDKENSFTYHCAQAHLQECIENRPVPIPKPQKVTQPKKTKPMAEFQINLFD